MLDQSFLADPRRLSPGDLIGSVQRSLTILELLAEHPAGLSAKQISQKTRLNLSTCYHLLNTLRASGYAFKDAENAHYRLSAKISYPAAARLTPAQLVHRLMPYLHALQGATRETAYLSVWDGAEIVLSAIVESPQSVRVKALEIGSSDANHASALGKAVLAYLPAATVHSYLERHPCVAYTPHTLSAPAALAASLAEVRAAGFSLDAEEFLPDVYCLGAPIFNAEDQILASIAISMPGQRYHAQHSAYRLRVIEAGRAASRNLLLAGCVGLTRPL